MDINTFIYKANDMFSQLGSIEKKIHVTWRNKNVIDKRQFSIIQNGFFQLKTLNPEYEFTIYEDDDIERYLQQQLSKEDYELIKNRKVVEKTDLWRLLIIYNEGGFYQDIDRFYNRPLSTIIKPETRCLLPTYYDADFSQDIMCSCSKNPIHKRAIELNLERRRNNCTDVLFMGPVCYMNAVTEVLLCIRFNREPGLNVFEFMRTIIYNSPYLETYREEVPYNTITYQGPEVPFDKDALYRDENVRHWCSY
jgi:hypothetical protein